MKKLVKGNEAVVLGALAAGCDAYFGYPITPASEIAEISSKYYLKLGKIFIQTECEVASINMLFGGASAGMRVMTASSGPGISLMQEGLSFFSGSEVPAVLVDIMRVGPGIGNIGAEQSDYFQVVKGGGHGTYRVIVLAPNSVAEMYSMTIHAFELADQYRMPVFVLSDGTLGQMMEPIDLNENLPVKIVPKEWSLNTMPESNGNVLTTIYLNFDDMERHILHLAEKFHQIEEAEAEAETYRTEGAEILLTGYGIVSRILHTAVDQLRELGIAAGLIRPKTLWPFPAKVFRQVWEESRRYCSFSKEKKSADDLSAENAESFDETALSDSCKIKRIAEQHAPILAVELSTGQYVDDVRLAVPNARIEFYGRVGGNLPSIKELVAKVREILS